MGEARTRSEAYPPLPDPARRRPTGPRGGSLTAATSMSGWVQSARKQPESEHTIREMASMLELSAALLRAETAAGAVRSVVQVCFAHLRVPLVGLLPDRSGSGWFVAAARGVGVKRADIVGSIEGVSAASAGPGDQGPSRDRLARAAGRDRAGPSPPGTRCSWRSTSVRPPRVPPDGRIAAIRRAHPCGSGWLGRRCAPTTSTSPSRGRRMSCVGRSSAPAKRSATSTSMMRGRRATSSCDGHVRSSKQLADLVDPLLRWSAGSCPLNIQQFDLVRTVEDVVATCRMEFDHAIWWCERPGTLVIRADGQQLEQAASRTWFGTRSHMRRTPRR